jgi:flagellar FliL protein
MADAKDAKKESAKDEKPADPSAADGAEGEAEGGEPKNKKLAGKTLVLFVAAPLLFLAGGGGTGYFLGLFGGGKHDEHAEEAKKPPKPAVFYNLPELLVNLNAQGRRGNFLKISLSLELDDVNDIPRVEAVLPRIVDAFQSYLRELRPEDLRGSSGMYRLREELLARVNASAQPAKVNDVLFKEMLVQ